MAVIEEAIETLVDKRFDERFDELKHAIQILRPWVKMDMASDILEKEARWIRANLCTYELVEKKLVKKVGGEWHFQNPEFFKYVHDVWWPNYQSE